MKKSGNSPLTLVLCTVVALPPVLTAATSASAHERERYVRKYDRVVVVKPRKYRDNSYAARAHDLDPAGDYKGYPDWARVALSPKFDGGKRR